jgi:hypothetical protein
MTAVFDLIAFVLKRSEPIAFWMRVRNHDCKDAI